ncbi:hypothetical protein LGM65_13040 [Burkholderia anthina]|uniref:hypothetical protein n=1 Tax=Burkholderia anthina TaxID=179879 RepID=UPI001CF5F1FA|nr:hypothetical protein [Burkholderia anthina]MCA8091809.1 hypothetical protein [Burkholderia anthina]
MLPWRPRWYVLATSRALHRHWQALFLPTLLLLPVMPVMPVFAQTRLPGAPVLAVLAPAHGIEWRFAWVHLLEAVGVLWVLAQRAAAASTCFLYGIWDFDARVVPLTLISQAAIASIAATTFRDLRMAHAHAAAFMRSLPRAEVAQVGADVLAARCWHCHSRPSGR